MEIKPTLDKIIGIWYETEPCVHYIRIEARIRHKEPITIDDMKCFNICRNGVPKGCVGYLTQDHIDKFEEKYSLLKD